MTLAQLQYPIGQFENPMSIDTALLNQWIKTLANLPSELSALVTGLNQDVLARRYRPGGWKICQLVHHLADSHMNAYMRFKLALTESAPSIKPYEEHLWAKLPDGKDFSIEASMNILKGIHHRWVTLIQSITDEQLASTYYHPANKMTYRLDTAIGMYDWHSRHHLAHIEIALRHDYTNETLS